LITATVGVLSPARRDGLIKGTLTPAQAESAITVESVLRIVLWT
jgi:hypothetical protein